VQAIVDDLLDGVAAHGPDRGVDLVAALAFPLPFPRESFEANTRPQRTARQRLTHCQHS
jgi:hypothetical protein